VLSCSARTAMTENTARMTAVAAATLSVIRV
jgi:hypothetical protein